MTQEPLIQIRHLSKAFAGREILRDVTMDIERNQITAIIGKSGTGKSVLVKHVIGLLEADGGDIFFDGSAYSSMSAKEFRAIKERCSYMFQNNALFDSLSVFENIALPLREHSSFSKAKIRDAVNARIEQLELSEISALYPKQISGGMQKRVALARALVTNPEIIFFDEPTTGLDPARKQAVFSMIHQYHERLNFTAVVISHDIPDIFYVAQKVHILDDGYVVFSGTPTELEQSDRADLSAYTHGQELLIDELTGLDNRYALLVRLGEFQKSGPVGLATLHIGGLRKLADLHGALLAHSFIRMLTADIRKAVTFPFCAGLLSQEDIALAAQGDNAASDCARILTSLLEKSEVRTFSSEHGLHLHVQSTILGPGSATTFSALRDSLLAQADQV